MSRRTTEADALLPDLDAVLYSFDILLSGIDACEPVGAAQPEFAEVSFVDEYDDPASGLYDDEVAHRSGGRDSMMQTPNSTSMS